MTLDNRLCLWPGGSSRRCPQRPQAEAADSCHHALLLTVETFSLLSKTRLPQNQASQSYFAALTRPGQSTIITTKSDQSGHDNLSAAPRTVGTFLEFCRVTYKKPWLVRRNMSRDLQLSALVNRRLCSQRDIVIGNAAEIVVC